VRTSLVVKIAVCVALLAITFAVFRDTPGYGFINFDDPAYVAGNPRIQAGLSWDNVVWAMTQVHSHNWHPLTTMSHILDCQIFGVNPGAHHLVNVLLHGAGALLLFLFLHQVTGGVWRSAFVAAVFAIHPLRVESVAWISERKDVLSGFFFMLTLLAYVRYTHRPTVWRYGVTSILFVCGLLAKPMLVTLPVVLLLLDYWPLERLESSGAARMIAEKIPLFVLSIACAMVTLIVQNTGALGLVTLEVLPLWWRVTNALSVYLVYVRQMFWPTDLALAYNHPGKLPGWEVAATAFALAALSSGALVLRKRCPYLLTGWSWYLVMLLPVIGLVQVGGQAHADRYTYLPQIGLLIAITWMVLDLTRPWRYRGPALSAVAIVVLSALGLRANDQVRYWRDSETLWRHALAVTRNNDMAHLNLGMILTDQKRLDDAIAELQGVVTRHPNDAEARLKLANALSEKEGRVNEAIREYEAVVRLGPNPDAETEIANLLIAQGRVSEALRYYSHVVEIEPSSALAHYNLAVGLHRLGQLSEAIGQYREALRIDPNYPDAQKFLEQALLERDQSDTKFRLKEL
jgi:Flp pilus assembly protein TadD